MSGSDIDQLDGNASTLSDDYNNSAQPRNNKYRNKMSSVAHHFPVVTVNNLRSLFPKVGNFKTDMLERQVDVSLCCEIWEKAESKKHRNAIEEMLELDGLKYFSTPRPRGKRGGGAAIIVNTERFKVEKLQIQIPQKLEIVWALAKPKHPDAQFKNIIIMFFLLPTKVKVKK